MHPRAPGWWCGRHISLALSFRRPARTSPRLAFRRAFFFFLPVKSTGMPSLGLWHGCFPEKKRSKSKTARPPSLSRSNADSFAVFPFSFGKGSPLGPTTSTKAARQTGSPQAAVQAAKAAGLEPGEYAKAGAVSRARPGCGVQCELRVPWVKKALVPVGGR